MLERRRPSKRRRLKRKQESASDLDLVASEPERTTRRSVWRVSVEYDAKTKPPPGYGNMRMFVDPSLDEIFGGPPESSKVEVGEQLTVCRTYRVFGTTAAHDLLDRFVRFFQTKGVSGAYAVAIRKCVT